MTVFSTNGSGKMRYHMQNYELDSFLALKLKINSKWIEGKTQKLKVQQWKKKYEEKFHTIRLDNNFSDMTPEAQATTGLNENLKLLCKHTIQR